VQEIHEDLWLLLELLVADLWLLLELLVAIIYFKTAERLPSPVSILTTSSLERVSWEIEIEKLSRDAEFWDSNAAEIIRRSGGCDYGIRKISKRREKCLHTKKRLRHREDWLLLVYCSHILALIAAASFVASDLLVPWKRLWLAAGCN
jgi:hypothetical protein